MKFSKLNPTPVNKALGATGCVAAGQASPQVQPGPAAEANGPRPSDVRFRSFAERYVVERARTFDQARLEDDAWRAVTEARTIYKMICETGRTIKE